MEIDDKLSKDLTDLKKQLESISGQKIDASPEQLFPLFFRVSLSTAEDGTVMSRSIFFPSKSCVQASGLPASLLDVSSRSSTGSDGKGVFLLSDFICSTINSFAEPRQCCGDAKYGDTVLRDYDPCTRRKSELSRFFQRFANNGVHVETRWNRGSKHGLRLALPAAFVPDHFVKAASASRAASLFDPGPRRTEQPPGENPKSFATF